MVRRNKSDFTVSRRDVKHFLCGAPNSIAKIVRLKSRGDEPAQESGKRAANLGRVGSMRVAA